MYKPPITWSKWIKQLTPTHLLSKSFSFVTSSSSSLIPSTVHVVLPSIITISQHIYRIYSHLTFKSFIKHTLLTFSEFRQQYGKYEDHILTDADLILILKYLASQSTIALAEDIQGYGTSYLVVKFIEQEMVKEITDHDKAVISIKTTCEALHHQVNELEKLIEKLSNSAKDYHNKKQQPQTLYALRRRKNVMKILEKRLMSMETMETMLLKMESAKDDMQIVQAFDNGATALRNILNEGFTTKSVEETMEKIQDIYDDQKDTENLLAQEMNTLNQSTYEDINDEALLKELEELELEQNQSLLTSTSPSSSTCQDILNKLDNIEKPPTTSLTSKTESSSNNVNTMHIKNPVLE
ncbi:Snf7-domain-containing protein [Cunninghamella echinulata]|nr:Snf7-domain-containing protein [Cunninghamella echinulata]